MSRAFKTISAKPTFGTLNENIYQSDYIKRKKGLITFCNSPYPCKKIKSSTNYETLNLYNHGKYKLSLDKCNIFPINKSNLIIGQYSKLNLNGVCTVTNFTTSPPIPDPCGSQPCNNCPDNTPVLLDQTKIFYDNYTIDPLGQLFGKTQCGELNYTDYIVFYPPLKPLTLGNY